MKKSMHQLFAVLFAIVFLQGCGTEGSKKDGMASVGITIPQHVAPKPMTKSAPLEAISAIELPQAALDLDIWISNFEPAATNELNCFGVIVGSDNPSEPGLRGKRCFVNETAAERTFGENTNRMGALNGETLNLEVPAGQDRRIDVIAWKANSTSACRSLRPNSGGVDVLNVSSPYLIGTITTNLQPGEQTVQINASFDETKKLVGCDIFVSNGAQAVLATPISGTVSGLPEPREVLPPGNDEQAKTLLEGNLILQINSEQVGPESLIITENGPFEFPTPLNDGEAFNVTILNQPFGAGCFVRNGTGVNSGTVPEVEVICSTEFLVVEGSASGIFGEPVEDLAIQIRHLRNGEDIVEPFFFFIDGNGSGPLLGTGEGYEFALPVFVGDQYIITIEEQPTLHTCVIQNGTGTINDNIFAEDENAPRIICEEDGFKVGGIVSGLDDESDFLVIGMAAEFYEEVGCPADLGSADEDCPVFAFVDSSDNTFTFDGLLPDGEFFAIEIEQQPFGKFCQVVNEGVSANIGQIEGADVTNFQISCEPEEHTIEVGISGVSNLELGAITVTMNEGLDSVTTALDIEHTFEATVTHGDPLDVRVTSAPAGVTCSVTGGQLANVIGDVDVNVTCFLTQLSLSGNVSGLNPGESITLQIPSLTVAASDPATGDFTFPVTFTVGDSYTVQIDETTVPEGFACQFLDGTEDGTFTGGDEEVFVSCQQTEFEISVIVNGIDGELGDGFVEVLNNTNEDLLNIVSNNVTSPFSQKVENGLHSLEIFPGELSDCVFDTNGTSTLDVNIAGADVTNIGITCTTEQLEL